MIEKILLLTRSLRDRGITVSTPEVMDCLKALAVAPYYNNSTVKAVIMACLVKDREDHIKFEESFRAVFKDGAEREKEIFPAMTGETEMEINAGILPENNSKKTDSSGKEKISSDADGPYLPGKTALMEIPFQFAGIKQREEMLTLIRELSRKMAGNMSIRKKTGRKRLNFRRLWRKSMQTGGIPFETAWQQRRMSKPRTFILCDFSSSMNGYLPFVLQFVFTFAASYSTVRVFGFVDAIEEITAKIDPFDIEKSIQAVYSSARIQRQGKTDYGNVLKGFNRHYINELTNRSSVIIVGDGRNNRLSPNARQLEDIRSQAAAVYWLNPEKWYYWGFADSCMPDYLPHCDCAFEMANLGQLKLFVDYLAAPPDYADPFPSLPVPREKWNLYLKFLQNWKY